MNRRLPKLIKAVADFFAERTHARDRRGYSAFKLRVAINALDLVNAAARAGRAGSDCGGRRAVIALLGMHGSLQETEPGAGGKNCQWVRPICKHRDLPSICGRRPLAKLAVDQPKLCSVSKGSGEEVVSFVPRRQRSAPFFTACALRAGAVTSAGVWYGPGSAVAA